jgi:hypothetical protein
MLYEYRRYEIMPGRAADLHRRFAEHTTKLFEKHGIRVVAFFEPLVGTLPELHYLLQWQDMAERERKWNAFQADPEWHAVRAKTEEHGPLVARIHNSFWQPTPYSPMQ